jgi:uncharacterized protein (UPF0332 family)
MACSPVEFLSLAKELSSGRTSEIHMRTAVNRGYYAVFHEATLLKQQLMLPDAINQAGNSHNRLYNALAECESFRTPFSKEVRQFSYMANGILKNYRSEADYDIDTDFPDKTVTDTIEKAELLLNKSISILANHNK